jgi:hypothetical protein
MTTMTLVWGFGLLAEAAVAVVLVLKLTIKQYLIVSPIIGYSATGLLTAWTFLYVRALRRRGEARRKAEAARLADAQDPGDAVPQPPS